MYPQLRIDLGKLEHNAKSLLELCQKNNVSVSAVTKVFCADSKIVELLLELPFEFLADARLENIESYPENRKARTMLLRLPSPSDVLRTVQCCDVSLNSELHTLRLLAQAAESIDVVHGVILMVDLGDLREGIYYKDTDLLYETVEYIIENKNLSLEGLGVNLTCYGSVMATETNLQQLCDIGKDIEEKYKVKLNIISGGNSSSIYLFEKDEMPENVNNLRLGESIVRGLETAYGKPFTGLKQNAITLAAEIIELQEKPSMPEGELGINAFGEKAEYTDIGYHKRAILSVGRQDIDYEGLECLEEGVEVIGCSSDHLILDVTKVARELQVGDIIEFGISYGGILVGFTSKYVNRVYV
jgi:predicted amino acid racemase